jgi:mevalonate kinase
MLIGEYAVLDGGPAVVAAVDCYAEARLEAPAAGAAPSPFILAAQREARDELGRLGRSAPSELPIVDTASFSRDGRKLGVGSSAAATVAAVGLLFQAAGLDLDVLPHRQAVFRAARRAHDAAQGVSGSGADVLASTWGGLQTLNSPGEPSLKSALSVPAPLELRFVATSRSASTAELIACYRAAVAAVLPSRERMARAAQRFIAACKAADPGGVLRAVADAQAAFLMLGEALSIDLVTDEHRAIVRAAERVGGAAKPSGAGGGDLAVVFLPDAAAAAAFSAGLPADLKAELQTLPLRISAHGVHAVPILEKQS